MVKKPPANGGDIRDTGLIPGSGRCPGGANGNPLQYSCLENPMDRGAWWATVHGGHEESDMTECACTDVCIKYQPLVYNGVEKKMMPLLSL